MTDDTNTILASLTEEDRASYERFREKDAADLNVAPGLAAAEAQALARAVSAKERALIRKAYAVLPSIKVLYAAFSLLDHAHRGSTEEGEAAQDAWRAATKGVERVTDRILDLPFFSAERTLQRIRIRVDVLSRIGCVDPLGDDPHSSLLCESDTGQYIALVALKALDAQAQRDAATGE